MSKVPSTIRDAIKDRLWELCDDLGWMALPDTERAQYYERWTRDPSIGGQLAHMMDPREVRVYIKDTLVKPYIRERLLTTVDEVWRLLGLSGSDIAVHTYIKPHGRRLQDGRIVSWGRSREWKSVLMAVFERGHDSSTYSPFGAVLVENGNTELERTRAMVRDAALRLGIEKLAWVEPQ